MLFIIVIYIIYIILLCVCVFVIKEYKKVHKALEIGKN